MPRRPSRALIFPLITSFGLMAAGMAAVLFAGPAQAATCPTVDSTTGAVSPAPSAGVDWDGCELATANLSGADLTQANLTGADFTSANLAKANLDGAKVSSTDFTSTVWSDTICANGRNSNSYAKHQCFAAPPKSPFTARALPTVSGDPVNDFIPTGVSCPQATQCWASATYADRQSAANQAGLEHLSGTQWYESKAPLPADAAKGLQVETSLAGMACPSASRCLAVGGYESKSGGAAMLLSRSGTKWTAARAPVPAGAVTPSDPVLSAIACPAATSCFAVGHYGDANREDGLILRLAGGTWTAMKAPTPAGDPWVELSGVFCPTTVLCFADGWSGSGTQTEPLIVRWSGGKWSTVKVPLPSGAAASPDAFMGGLSCPGTTHCVAVGRYLDTKGHLQGVLLTRSGTTWTATKAPLLSGAAANPEVTLNAVSCPTASQCTVGGGYQNTAAQSEGLLLAWSGKTWKAEPTPRGAYMVKGISCPTTKRCVAVSPDVAGPVGLTGP